ncbi:MAG TPA: DUF1549 domain-containing protein, partial [Candidatus Saccharimonadales bacterium]|nr:DUF1549 domain-containing protein [Candidatus Saccharimonadales bacterium]
MKSTFAIVALFALLGTPAWADLTPAQIKALPPAATHPIDFKKEIKPIFEATCIRCHARGRSEGGLKIDTRQTLLKGGDSGPAVVPGHGEQSYLVSLVGGVDPDEVMPKKGTKLTREQVGVLRAWIDQGLPWDSTVEFGPIDPLNLHPHTPMVPIAKKEANPVDRFMDVYFQKHGLKPAAVVNDRFFARRVYLDTVGLLPPQDELEAFVAKHKASKREELVKELIERGDAYAENWMTFWNDMLRNDYKGTGYIDGGRTQITRWLYSALLTNMPYDQFVSELVSPTEGSAGFTKGIVWRGTINASQTPQMQASQNISQVFMGVNLKCASCHDSFINDWQLSDSYGLANVYADAPLQIYRCDKPTGKKAPTKFIFSQLGEISGTTNKQERLRELARIITCPQDGRLSRTIVNRLWAKFMGRGLVEPVDDMQQRAWNQDLLDWLAEDLVAHHYDLKVTITRILTSRAYQLPAVDPGELPAQDYVFTGPEVRRMSAEEFRDALTSLSGVGYPSADANLPLTDSKKDKFGPKKTAQWVWNDPHAADKAKAGSIYLRKTINLPILPNEAMAMVMCDNSFTVFVNGHKAGSGNDYSKSYMINLKPFLRKGTNLIAVQAINRLPDNSLPTRATAVPGTENPAGLYIYARVRGPERGPGKVMDFVSDASWVATDQETAGWEKPDFDAGAWKPIDVLGTGGMAPWRLSSTLIATQFSALHSGNVRAVLVAADPLQVALGRPNREQVVTTRATEATTLQALELTNGKTLAELLKR